ncbi:hypothetical protein N0M98_24820 [Paenibacillus doosanensis]|uniref:Uncharacterized protein n=1 Tax=Paenibacillus konkukensis TaxID=2020716 RepID=A0ABY4RZB3_9BACL|nr:MULTISPECIES: hypothetical protein [Paenibacillus]MCS7463350.1 hypothetical protein [Paenibacillus doosanensis]UQZ87657.1 hypothetical protein SK3146_06959 [Paenibacillus konkukensis]
MKKIVWFSLLFPLPFAFVYYINSNSGIECAVYYALFAALLLVALLIRKRKPPSDRDYDDYMI